MDRFIATRWFSGFIRPGTMHYRLLCLTVVSVALVTSSCSGSSGNSSSANPPATNFTTSTCEGINGHIALNWDFYTQTLRGDYPLESTQPPANPGGSFLHPRLSLLFLYPVGWSATAIIDSLTTTNEPATLLQGNLTVLAGASVLRNDGAALWRYLHTTESNTITAQQRLNEEIERILNGFSINDQPTEVCSMSRTGSTAGFEGALSASLLRTNAFTIQVITTQTVIPQVFQGNSLVTTSMVAPNAQFDSESLQTFLPLGWQQIRRGSGDTQCSDGIDNDADGLIDLLDPGCESASDNSE